jgi:amino-acid N-acetyltransferase
VGVIGLELYDDAALLRSVAVDPDRRGSGVGDSLVRMILEHASERRAREVFLLTTTAERYFPRLGFSSVRRDEVPLAVQRSVEFREACPTSATVMRKVFSEG